jgi:hypothetical protein
MEKNVQLEKRFLAKFFDVEEDEITHIEGLTFDVPGAPDEASLIRLVGERHKRKMQNLAEALTSDDDLGKVVRGLIHIEHELEEVIYFASPNPDYFFTPPDFTDKVRLGLQTQLLPPSCVYCRARCLLM